MVAKQLKFGPGIYSFGYLDFVEDVEIIGDDTVFLNTRIMNHGSNLTIRNIRFENNPSDWEERVLELNVFDCVIENCTFIGSKHSAINFKEVHNKATVRNCVFFPEDGDPEDTTCILVNGSLNDEPLVLIQECQFIGKQTSPNTAAGGVTINYDSLNNLNGVRAVIQNNEFRNIGQNIKNGTSVSSPIHIYRNGRSVIIQNNRIINTGSRAIQVQHSKETVIQNNIIIGETYPALLQHNSGMIHVSGRQPNSHIDQNIVISNNMVLNTPTHVGIRVTFDFDHEGYNLIVDGNIVDNVAAGIWLDKVNDFIIKNNVIKNIDRQNYGSNYKGIYVFDCNGVGAIQSNQIHWSGNPNQGIMVFNGDMDLLNVSGNQLRNCGMNSIDVRNTNKVIVADNQGLNGLNIQATEVIERDNQ